eukprot:gnl/Trimastix_PCT/1085.p1 GENE.gnl/Trimastix_PCT/1085~~gnl/Trimastix_PCT/1085.p1  ORF type:complete len:253 (+),score=46.03 gnl/Trimastix_PCT/1085:36-794(+)
MARRYDSRTTIFSPDGHLYQVQYAIEAVGHAGVCIGIQTNEGIILVCEQKNISKLLDQTQSEKLYKVDDHIVCAIAGITADANTLLHYARTSAQRYTFRFQEPMPVEQLVQDICDLKQNYTQFGGLRPYGVSFLFAGYDLHHGFQLYMSSPSGNYCGWFATAVGANSSSAVSMLRQDYTEGMSMDAASGLALKVLAKTMDTTKLSKDKLEFATLTLRDGAPTFTMLPTDEIDALITRHADLIARSTEEEVDE